MFQNSKIQKFIAQAVVSELSDKLHSKVSVGKVEYKLFNSISINDLYVEDLQRDTLLFVHEADAHFNFWKFFQGKILFTSVEFNQLYGNLVVDAKGHTNLDFVIKAFEKPQTNDSTQIEYRINHFKLKNSTFCFTNLKQYKKLPNKIFNPNKLRFNKINADISLDLLNKDTLSARVLKLSAVEQSGFVVTNFSTRILGSRTKVQLPTFDLKLPNSQLHLEDVQLKYDSLSDFKHFAEKVRLKAPISSSYFSFGDFSAFVPDFKGMGGVISLKGLISGRFSSLRFQKVEIKNENSFLLKADLDINGLPNINEAFIYGKINELHFEKSDLQDFISDISKKPFLLPTELNQLGLIRYTGNVTGFLSNLVAYGNLKTNLGSISTDILVQLENKLKDLTYNGTIKSADFMLGRLLNNKQIGKVSFNFNTKGTKKENRSLQGTIDAKVPEFQFNSYSYRDIKFNGDYDGNGFNGKIDVEDENINAHFNGIVDLTQKLPVFDFNLRVTNTNLNALKLTDKFKGALLSFNGKTNMVGNSLDNINGFIRFDSIVFSNQDKTLNIDKIQFVSRIERNFSCFSILSDCVNGSFSGNFKYSGINNTINKIIRGYLPAFSAKKTSSKAKHFNHIDVNLEIANAQNISDVLALPYTLDGVSSIKGYIDEKSNKIDLQAELPMLKSKKQTFENISLHIENPKQLLELTSKAQLKDKKGQTDFLFVASAAKDTVLAQIGWHNSGKTTNAGEVKAITKFRNEFGKIAAQVSVLPTQVIILDSIWNIHPSIIDFNTDSTICVHNFLFDNQKQFVQIDGVASKNQKDSINLVMNDLDLSFIMNILRLRGISIGGNATGRATLFSVLQKPIFEANIGVKGLKLNNKWIGNGNLFSAWDKLNNQLLANGTFVNQDNDTIIVANAVYIPKYDSISVDYNTKNLSIEFLTPYFETVVQNAKGFASGKVHMFGPLKTGVKFEGDIYIDKGQLSVNTLQTTYFFNDSVHLRKKSIEFRNIKMYDQERNKATMNALLSHNGYFQRMKYDARLKGNNILALNTQSEDNDYFFGKAYVDGTVRIYGDEKEANIWANAVSQPQTKCYIQMGGVSNASDNSFINFVNKKARTRKELGAKKSVQSTFNVKVNLQIEATPDAEMELIVDPKGGDVITGKGSGNLRVEFDTFSDIKLYGTYTINNGYYLFTLQNVIRKEFKIDQGSTIAWTGDPFNAQVNIRALYPLTASLKDLDETLLNSTNRASVPVNCVLKLTDNLMKPTINFDIDLPSSDEGVKQRVRNIINTDEMMNRQLLYLLVFNKFFTPEYLRSTTSNVLNNEGYSFLVSTLSAQLNSLVSRITKSDNLTVGIDYRQTDQLSSDIKAQILYQPNNRWVVNGNIGYRNDNIATNTNKFIGDVDVEYLLTESGKLRLKGYNHTVDRLQLRTAKTTQGFGFLYKQDFNNFDDLFRYYWQLLTNTEKKKTNEDAETNKK